MTELELLMKPAFLLVGASGFFSMIGFFVPLFFLPDMAMHKGIDSARANFLISIYGEKKHHYQTEKIQYLGIY